VTPGNGGDASVAEDLISELLVGDDTGHDDLDEPAATADVDENDEDVITVYGHNAYGTGGFQERLDGASIDSRCKTQQPTAPGGLFTKDCFVIDLHNSSVTCPAGERRDPPRWHGLFR